MIGVEPYMTLAGKTVPFGRLSADEQSFVHDILAFYQIGPDWGVYGNFWRPRLLALCERKGLTRKQAIATPLYQIAEDLEMRLAIAQGQARLPDYRDLLGALIRDKFQTCRAFCKATGLSEDLVSHVLAGRKHLAIDNLTRALAKIGYRLAIVPDQTATKKKTKSAG